MLICSVAIVDWLRLSVDCCKATSLLASELVSYLTTCPEWRWVLRIKQEGRSRHPQSRNSLQLCSFVKNISTLTLISVVDVAVYHSFNCNQCNFTHKNILFRNFKLLNIFHFYSSLFENVILNSLVKHEFLMRQHL